MWPLWRRRNCHPLRSKIQALLKGTTHPKTQLEKKNLKQFDLPTLLSNPEATTEVEEFIGETKRFD